MRAIFRETAGDLWVGTEIGLNRIRGDQIEIFTTADGLSSNAIRAFHQDAGGEMWIGTRGGGLVRFHDGAFTPYTSRDNGIGIDPKYHDKVFGLFERLDAATEGTGVGLALVKRIVEMHGGRVWIESQGGGSGSTFCLTLPGDRMEVRG